MSDTTKLSPILPFDITFNEHHEFYDNFTYTQNIAYTGQNYVRMESGNVFKYYRCSYNAPILVGGN